MVDADQHEGAGGTEARHFLDGLGQRRDQMRAVEFAGQGIVARQLQELFVAGVALVVEADNALRARRLAVGPCEPGAGFLDPQHRQRCAGPHAIFDPIGRAVAAARERRRAQRVGPDRAHRLDQLCKLGTAGERFRRDIAKNGSRVIAPDDLVGCDIPDEGGLAEQSEDGGSLRSRCHSRLVSGHCRNDSRPTG